MKKFFLTTGFIMVTAITATYAQDNAVSVFTRNQFASDFPDAANIRFEKKNDFDEVNYSQEGKNATAYYDDNSELIGTFRDTSFHDLPADAQTKIVDRYPNYTVVRVVRFNVNSDNESYTDNNTELPYSGDSSEDSSHYFVELKNDNKAIVLMVGLSGEVSFYTTMK